MEVAKLELLAMPKIQGSSPLSGLDGPETTRFCA
jgi:hypothetical protein